MEITGNYYDKLISKLCARLSTSTLACCQQGWSHDQEAFIHFIYS